MCYQNEYLDDLNDTFLTVNGNWGEWSGFGGCSTTCGGGSHQRKRLCNNPPAAFGGLECLVTGSVEVRASEESEAKQCNEKPCPGKNSILKRFTRNFSKFETLYQHLHISLYALSFGRFIKRVTDPISNENV